MHPKILPLAALAGVFLIAVVSKQVFIIVDESEQVIVTQFGGKPRIVVSDRRTGAPVRYLWEYTWTN